MEQSPPSRPAGPSLAPRRPAAPLHPRRRAIVVVAGHGRVNERGALALNAALNGTGFEARYVGEEQSARRIAKMAADENADSIELCLGTQGGVMILRDLLRELDRVSRRHVSVVIHRIE